MGRIRRFVKDDIPDLVRLRRTVFRASERPSEESLAESYERVLLHNPWYDESLPSLVYENARGRPCGFIGVVPRPMQFEGERVRCAVSTELMVDQEERGIAGIQLLQRFLAGEQDVSLSDRANDAARKLCELHGGATSLWYSLYWNHALRPSRYGLSRLGWRGALRGVKLALRPVCSAFDAFATRVARGRYRQEKPQGTVEPLDPATIVTMLPRVVGRASLVPLYDVASVTWLLHRLEEKQTYSRLETVQVRDAASAVIGWFVYYLRSRDHAEVVQLAAVEGRHKQVLDHLLYHAWRGGAITVAGRVDRLFAAEFDQRGFRLSVGSPWTIVHSRNARLQQAFQSGAAFLSRLDAEWWLSF